MQFHCYAGWPVAHFRPVPVGRFHSSFFIVVGIRMSRERRTAEGRSTP